MKRIRWIAGIAFLVVLGLVAWAAPQAAEPKPGDPPALEKKDTPPAPPTGEKRDPTKPSPDLEKLLNPPKPGTTTHAPLVTLKGRLISRDRKAAALLDVGGKIYDVRTGSELNIPGPNGGTLQLRVTEVNAREVRIEVGAAKELWILR